MASQSRFATVPPADSLDNLFCDQCGSLMTVVHPRVVACSQGCANSTTRLGAIEGTFAFREPQRLREVTIHDETTEEEFDPRPTVSIDCPECGHDTAYGREEQLRAADEPGTQLLTCTECRHTWRADG